MGEDKEQDTAIYGYGARKVSLFSPSWRLKFNMNSEKVQATQAQIDATEAQPAVNATKAMNATNAMKPITLCFANVRGNEKNYSYPYKAEVHSLEDLLGVVRADHVGAVYKDTTDQYGNVHICHRAKKNFIEANSVMMDLDNDGTNNPAEWLTPEALADRFPRCQFYVIYSRHNNKVKHEGKPDEKSPRPRFHVYFPLSEKIYDAEEFKALKDEMRVVAPELDNGAKDAARFFFGVEKPEGATIAGDSFVDVFIKEQGITLKEETASEEATTEATKPASEENKATKETKNNEKPAKKNDKKREQSVLKDLGKLIKIGDRHGELLKYANAALKAYGDCKIAELLYWERVKDCESPKEEDELRKIWADARAHFHEWAAQAQNWTMPTEQQLKYARKWLKERENGEKPDEEPEKEGKKNLTLPAVEKALADNGVTARLNVITREVEVSDYPLESPYLPESYRSAKPSTRKGVNAPMLPAFLTSYLRDENFTVNSQFLNDALNVLTTVAPLNPFEDMLKAEAWDCKDRIFPLCQAIGLDVMDSHFITFMQKWLLQVVSMALNDDAELGNEFCLVLQGAEGTGKTEFFRRLAVNKDWFLDGATIDTSDKDSIMRATRVLICELGELDSTMNKEQSALKSFITAKFDVYRAPYGRSAQKYERRTAFCATVNPDKFLRDSAGSRRWVVVPVTWIDKKFVIETMTPEWVSQLWRQVYTQFYITKGRKWYYLTDEEKAFTREQNSKASVLIDGEIELLDMLDWNVPPEKWRWYTNTQIISNLQVYKISAVKMARALNALMSKDKRVQYKKTRTTRQYLLPPKKGNVDEVFPPLTEEEARKFLRNS